MALTICHAWNYNQIAANQTYMKIIILTSSLGSGGAERVACILANAWASRGIDVTLIPTFSGRGECFYDVSSSVSLVYLADLVSSRSRSVFNKFVRLLALRRFVRDTRPDVIISFLSNVNVATILSAFGLKLPVVVCERTDPFIMPMSPLLRLACRITYPHADALLVQTKAVADKYRSCHYPLKHLRVIANPIAEDIMQLRQQVAQGSTRTLIAIGRLDEGKQFDILIKVFALLAPSHPSWVLRIFGDGPLRDPLQRQIAACGLESRIFLMGRTKDIGTVLCHSDLFVMTSRYEGFPNVLLEAMAVGLPCIVYDCPSGPREITQDGKFASLLPLNDERALESALEKLMLDNKLRQNLGSAARRSVKERYILDRVLEQWDRLFAFVRENATRN
jgi:glycosyltransferase involved in cell wall biosynthesis